MGQAGSILKRQAPRLTALAIVAGCYAMAQLPSVAETELAQLASRFSFTALPLPEVPGPALQRLRPVHPSLRTIQSWVSSVGASVALNDIDGDGLANDVCYVEVRTDQVIVAPVPGTPERYRPFELRPEGVAYDAATMAPMGCLPGDLNEDGRMDVLIYYWGRPPVAFLRRAGEAVLAPSALVARDVAPANERWYSNTATRADLDGDGHPDLVIGNYFADGAWILDANGQGGTQVMQHSMSRADNGGRNRLLLWQSGRAGDEPQVAYRDASGALDAEVQQGWTLAVGAADLDGDLSPEIYFANDFGPDHLLHNLSRPGQLKFARLEGRKTLTKPNSKVLGRDSFKGMGVDFGDVNGDGRLDIYVSNIAAEYSLQESHFLFVNTGENGAMADGRAPFVDESEALGLSRSGWGWDAKLADFDNDGVPEAVQATGFVKGTVDRWPELQELAMANDELLKHPGSWPRFRSGDDLSGHQHNAFFVQSATGRYVDIARELHLEPADDPFVTRGIAIADVEGDGDLDFVLANQWAPSVMYRNDQADGHAFLGLHLYLPLTAPETATAVADGHADRLGRTRAAIGASVRVDLPDGRLLVAQVDGGNGHSGRRSPDLFFGLGNLPAGQSVGVRIDWRDAAGQPRREELQLRPGWHSIVLGTGQARAEG